MKPLISIRKFDRGIADSYGRGKEPEGSFVDVKNFVPTKVGSLETPHGYASDLASLPTAFPDTDENSSGTINMVTVKAKPFPFSAEVPTAYDGRVYFLRDNNGSPADHVLLDSWFWGSTTKVSSPNSGFVMLDERKVFHDIDDIKISYPTDYTIQVVDASTIFGLSTTNGYYGSSSKPSWVIKVEKPLTTTQYLTVIDYTYSAGTATFSVKENIGAGGLALPTPDDTVVFTVMRWFHYGQFYPTFGTRPGQPFAANGRVRGCGGPSSDANYYPWIAQYINRTFFNGANEITYQGTYVDSMNMDIGLTVPLHNITTPAAGGGQTAFDGAADTVWQLSCSLEYDGYEEGRLSAPSASTTASAGDVLQFDLDFKFARLNKRVTAVNIYMASVVSNVVSSFYFIRRIPIVDDDTYTWTWGANTGVFELAGQVIDLDDWSVRGGSYLSRTGRIGDAPGSDIVTWQYTEVVNGRRFFANYYVAYPAMTEVDSVKYTPIDSNGNSCYDVVPSDSEYVFDVATGDPGSIKGLAEDQGNLIIFKDDSIFSIHIGADPATWVRSTVSLQDGLAAVDSICKLPSGGLCFADTDAFKLLQNHRITPLTENIKTAYGALTTSGIVSWYDKDDRTVNFTTGLYTGLTHYKGFLDLLYRREDGKPCIPWYKIVATHGTEFVATLRDESVIFTNSGTFPGVFKWGLANYTFGGASNYIVPYLKTHHLVADEGKLIVLDKVMFVKGTNGDGGTLRCTVSVDGGTAISQSGMAQDKANLFLKAKVTEARTGRKVQVEYNTVTLGERDSDGRIQLDGIYIYGIPIEPAGVNR